jgi:stage III sporulation protein AG
MKQIGFLLSGKEGSGKDDKDGGDKKKLPGLWVLLALGVVLLIVSSMFSGGGFFGGGFFGGGTGGGSVGNAGQSGGGGYVAGYTVGNGGVASLDDHIRSLEQRLEEVLGLVDGAGRVRVMITASRGRELVVAQTSQTERSVTDEEDSAGGTRNSETVRGQDAFVFARQNDGSEVPLILKELEPQIEGVAIIAEGGDNIAVKDALTRATFTVLGIAPHKVQVVTMTTQNNINQEE